MIGPTKKKAVFCPACGAASIDQDLVGDSASCRVCTWAGPAHELAALHFEGSGGTDEEVLRNFFLDLRGVLGARFASEIAALLTRWGFLGAAEPRILARYLAAAARAMVTSIVEERGRIEKEVHGKA